MSKVAVVTGSNKGIGFAIVRGLCKQFDGDVFLTARDVRRGSAAVEELKKEGLSPKFHQLDLNDQESIERLRDFLQQNYGGLDVLVNNAAIAYKEADPAPFSQQVEDSMKTNFWGTLAVCEALFPILKPGARVSHVSSRGGTYALQKCSAERQKEVCSLMSIAQVKDIMTTFVSDAAAGEHQAHGWPNMAYGMSKLGLTAITPMQQDEMDKDNRKDIIINACCPGYVDTDMSSHKGHLTIDQGADTPLYLALLPPGIKTPQGKFVCERKVNEWKEAKI